MDVEVDQSVKTEDTSGDTVLAFSNDKQFGILIPAEVKRQALAYLRGRGKSRRISVLLVFAAGLFLLSTEKSPPFSEFNAISISAVLLACTLKSEAVYSIISTIRTMGPNCERWMMSAVMPLFGPSRGADPLPSR